MVKLKSKPKPPTLNCSPLKRRNFIGYNRRLSSGNIDSCASGLGSTYGIAPIPLPAISTNAKSLGVKKIISQYTEMENEVMTVKRRYFESRQKVRALKDILKEQRTKSRQLIVSCALKLQEKENELEALKKLRQEELSAISRELVFLKSNMLKEQKKVAKALAVKDTEMEKKEDELQRMRQLAMGVSADLNDMEASQADLDTPDTSPDSSPHMYSVPRFHIRPLGEKRPGHQSPGAKVPPPLPPPYQPGIRKRQLRFAPARGHSADEAFCCTPGNALLSDSGSSGNKEKDSGKDSDSEHYEVIDIMGHLHHEEEKKENIIPPALPARPIFRTASRSSGDEGFSSCYEEIHRFSDFLSDEGMNQRSIISPSVALTNHKRFQKPSDVKQRRTMKTVMAADLTVLEEHQISSAGDVTTVTYCSGQYL